MILEKNKKNITDREQAIRETLPLWLRLLKIKAIEEAGRECLKRRDSRFIEPRIRFRAKHRKKIKIGETKFPSADVAKAR